MCIAFRTERENGRVVLSIAQPLPKCSWLRSASANSGWPASLIPGRSLALQPQSGGDGNRARKMIEQLRRSMTIDPTDELVCLAASLLHDLGHGPFSHVFERVGGIHHEKLTRHIITDPASEVHQILAEHDPQLPTHVVAMLEGQGSKPMFGDILSSQLDADRLDYLLRDNLMTGSRYGDYDLGWLLHSLTTDEASGRLAVTWKGVVPRSRLTFSRALSHVSHNVYYKVVRAAEGMVKLALQASAAWRCKIRCPGRRAIRMMTQGSVRSAVIDRGRLPIWMMSRLSTASRSGQTRTMFRWRACAAGF